MNYSSHLVLSMLLKNTGHMWYSSIFQKELKDVYRGEGSILILLWHKLEQLHCSVILVWISSSIIQGIILPNFYCISSFRFCCCCCWCHSCWFVGCLLSLHSHFKRVPDTRLCDFTFVRSLYVVGQANEVLFWGEKSGCRLFIYFFWTRQKMRALKSMLFYYIINIMIVGMKEL